MRRVPHRFGPVFFLTVEKCRIPDCGRSRSGLFATKTTIEEMGFPLIPASRRLEAVLYSAGSPIRPAAVVLVANEMIRHRCPACQTRMCDARGGDSPGHRSTRAFCRKTTIEEMDFPLLRSPGGWRCDWFYVGWLGVGSS